MPSCFSCFGQSSRGSASASYSAALPADYNELDREQLKELYDRSIALNSGRLIVHGIFARADTKNNNKRVYPKYLLKREVDKYEVERISKGTALGELDHPNYASRYFKCLNLPNISHQVLEVQWKGNQLWGSIEVLPTPSGLLLWELYSQGIKLGVSSRGWASLRTDTARKCVFVDDDFELITFDFVTEPSTKDAYLVPLQRTFQLQHLPDQKKVVQIAHMGHGVCSMELVPQLPPGSLLAARITELKAQSSGKGAAALQAPGSLRAPDVAVIHRADQQYQQSRLQHLDKLLLYSHYVVDQDAMYLDREKDARNFQAHLTMFASRAHLSNQQHTMSKADLNALIMQEVATKDAAGSLSWSVPRQPVQGTQGFMHLAECQGQQAEEAPAGWPMYPHASAGPASTVVEAARRLQAQQEASTSGSTAGGSRPFAKQSSRSRVHPAPAAKTAAAAGGAPGPQQRAAASAGGVVGLDAGTGPPPGVMQELQRIKATLAKYSQVQQRLQQQILQAV